MNHIEVELRGPLDEAGYKTIQAYLDANGKHTNSQKRVFFDLSQAIGINNRTLDVRVKTTNGKIQIVVKKSISESSSREEAEVNIEAGSLKQALHALALLGYPKGVSGIREIERYTVGEIEFAVQSVMRIDNGELHSRFYEAEIMANPENKDEAEKRLRELLAEIKLPVFDREGWNAYEAKLNREANGWFDFDSTDISQFLT